MVKIDANQEAIALIRMAIDNDNKSRTLQGQTDHETDSESEMLSLEQHWTFGSRISSTRLDSRALEKQLAPDDDFMSFDERLRSFITHCFPEEAPRYEDLVYVCPISLKLVFFPWLKL
jgi:predicted P-loop ATPase